MLVGNPTKRQTLIADDLVWELAYAPAIDHPARLTGRSELMRHLTWFLGAVENFRFIEPKVYACADPQWWCASESGGSDHRDGADLSP